MRLCADSGENREASQVPTPKKITFVVFSGDFDRLAAAFTMANAAAAMGVEVSMFFNFWGILALRERRRLRGKSLLDGLLSLFLPRGLGRSSRMSMFGLGPVAFGRIMRHKKVSSVPELLESARELDVRLVACQTSLEVFGVGLDELPEGFELGGAAGCVQDSVAGSVMFV